MAILRWIHLTVVLHFVQIITASDGKFYQVLMSSMIQKGAISTLIA